jgi:hypothetical protein
VLSPCIQLRLLLLLGMSTRERIQLYNSVRTHFVLRYGRNSWPIWPPADACKSFVSIVTELLVLLPWHVTQQIECAPELLPATYMRQSRRTLVFRDVPQPLCRCQSACSHLRQHQQCNVAKIMAEGMQGAACTASCDSKW